MSQDAKFWKCCWILILFANLSPVSGLCSTCLEEECYDNGECIIGCIPGYIGKYCEEACPSRCLKACHLHRTDGAITCTDGCSAGFCGPKCFRLCPDGCVTCDSQCGSCNVTLCPEGRYGTDCTETCRSRYEKCERETGNCTKCMRGYYGDECTQVCRLCFNLTDNIRDTCLSGCDICKTQETCRDGFYGNSCKQRCKGCKNPGGCNKATGECSAGCVSGYHGLTCNYTCSEHCLSGKCNKSTAECSVGCVSGYYGQTCNYTCDRFCVDRICNMDGGNCTSGCINGYRPNFESCETNSNKDDSGPNFAVVIAVPITVIFCMTVPAVAFFFIYRKKRSKGNKDRHSEDGNSSADNHPGNSSGVNSPLLEPDCTEDIATMVLLGKTGVGKSATGNTIVGTTRFDVGLSTTPVTLKCKQHTIDRDGQKLQLIDTPGFLGSKTREEDVKACVEECFRLSCKGQLHAILFLIEIGRFTVNDSEIINQFIEIFGEESKNFVIVIFTKFDNLKREKQFMENFIGNAPKGLTDFLQKTNNRYLEVDNWSDDEVEKNSFINKLLIMLRSLLKVNGSRCYTKQMFRAVRNNEEES